MTRLTDNELLNELQARFEENRKALHDLRSVSDTLGIMNRKLQESEALKSNFLANIRNELNNPLTVILGMGKVLGEKLESGSEAAAMAELIYAEAFNFYFQLRNILTAASLEAGESQPFFARIDLCHQVRMIMASYGHLALKKRVSMECDCAGHSAEMFNQVYCDAEKLQIILANLLANAIEFSHDGGEVEVGVARTEAELQLTVRDHGLGIPAGKREAVFDRFRQLDMGVRKAHRGNGIGLSVTRELVDILGGSIVVSGPRGGGSLFTVKLPLPSKEQQGTFYADSGNAFVFDSPDDDDEFTEAV